MNAAFNLSWAILPQPVISESLRAAFLHGGCCGMALPQDPLWVKPFAPAAFTGSGRFLGAQTPSALYQPQE